MEGGHRSCNRLHLFEISSPMLFDVTLMLFDVHYPRYNPKKKSAPCLHETNTGIIRYFERFLFDFSLCVCALFLPHDVYDRDSFYESVCISIKISTKNNSIIEMIFNCNALSNFFSTLFCKCNIAYPSNHGRTAISGP
uniref:Uncharacterized protein n=1 Tax=Ditylum brightwellii TaxID=49249 RepID=A0A7S4SL13_9STRA